MRPSILLRFMILTLLLAIAACGGESSPTGPGGAGGASPDRIVIVGPQQVPVANGQAFYRAFALYEGDRPQEDITDQVQWSSDDESSFTVDAGVITILQGGLAHVRARLGNTEGKLNLSLVVRSGGLRLPLVSGDEHLPQIGDSTQLTAKMSFPGQFDVDVTGDVLWESSDPSVVHVDIHGVATSVGNGEAYVVARYGTSPGTLNLVAGPMPDKTYDVTVVAIRLDADKFCEASDEGDAEFSYEFTVTTSAGDEYTIAATNDYPSSESYATMQDGPGATGLLKVDGEASFVLSEIQSFKLTARVTEWDHEFYYFGDWIPDPEADDMTEAVTHRGSNEFDEGLHEIALASSAGNCDLQFEYRIVVTER